MAVRLYNQTRLPDDLLRRLLARTARRIGARSGIIVKVTRAQTHQTGDVESSDAMREWWCKRGGSQRWIKTDGARMRIALRDREACDEVSLFVAHNAIALMLHEWSHVADCQVGGREHSRRGPSGRKPHWTDRPEEVRAQFAAKQANEKPSQLDDDLELELAEALRKEATDA